MANVYSKLGECFVSLSQGMMQKLYHARGRLGNSLIECKRFTEHLFTLLGVGLLVD